jgi:hypothetical protein
MKELIVSLEIKTSECSLDELSSRIGIQHAEGSFDKGKVYQKRISEDTVWKLFSGAEKHASLDEHCRWIFKTLSTVNILRTGVLPKDYDLTLNIGVLYDSNSVTCSLSIPNGCLKLMRDYELNIEVSCYPCTD